MATSVTPVVRKRNRGVGLAGRRGIEAADPLVLRQGRRYVCLFGGRAMAARNRCAANPIFSQRVAYSGGALGPFDPAAGRHKVRDPYSVVLDHMGYDHSFGVRVGNVIETDSPHVVLQCHLVLDLHDLRWPWLFL